MEVRKAENLSYYRVKGSGPMTLYGLEMSPEEVIERRAYIRQALRNTSSNNLFNEILDNIRLLPNDNGYLLEDTEGRMFYIKSEKVTVQEAEFRKVRAMMPFEFINLTGKDFDWNIYGENVSGEKETINRYIVKFEQFRQKGMGLYIYSAVKGSGKTMLSCCLINELVKRYALTVKFINSLELLELTKQAYKGTEPEELQSLYQAAVLVIDDIGVQMSKEWVDTVFYRLINTRYNNRLVTIYTSNMPVNLLKMDDRIVDRIESTTYAIALPEVPVRSRIRQQAKEEMMNKIKNAPV